MVITFERNRTSTIVVMYSLYLYFLGLSLRNTSRALVILRDEKRSYVSFYLELDSKICRVSDLQKKVSAFIIDEIVIQIGSRNFDYGYILNQSILQCLEYTFTREICLLLKNSSNLLLRIMENILYILMEISDMMKHVIT